MWKSIAGMALAWLTGCSEQHLAYVECVGAGVGYQCAVTHQQGSRPIDVCWTIAIECLNGQRASANACQDVAPQGKTTKLVPLDQIKNAEACDMVSSVAVKDLVVKL